MKELNYSLRRIKITIIIHNSDLFYRNKLMYNERPYAKHYLSGTLRIEN